MVSFAEKLNTLIEKTGKGWMSKPQLAKAITAATGVEMDANYMWKLCKGKVPDPRLTTIEQLATYFGVKASYFTDSSNHEADSAVLDLLETMRAARVENLGMRTADLSPSALKLIGTALNRAIDSAPELEGLEPLTRPDEENHER